MESFRRNKTEAAETTEFLGLQIDSEFKWKIRTEYVIHKLSSLCVTMRPVMVLMGGGGGGYDASVTAVAYQVMLKCLEAI